MSTTDDTNPYPVDSVTRICCGGIGAHIPTCIARDAGRGIPDPAGALTLYDWYVDTDEAGNPELVRAFRGSHCEIDTPGRGPGCQVWVYGMQHGDGAIERGIWVDNAEELSAATARQLARALISAADEIDRVSERDTAAVIS